MTHFERLCLRLSVEEVNVSVVGPAQDLVAVLAEPDGEEAEAAVLSRQRKSHVTLLVPEDVHLVD